MDLSTILLNFIGYTLLLIFAIILLYSFVALIFSVLCALSLPFLWLGSAANIIEGNESDNLLELLGKGFVYALVLFFAAED